MNNNNNGPCGACKFLRRKCIKGCIFAPYFDSNQGTSHFAAVHKVFGASNASKLLLTIPAHKRPDAVVTLCYEALARVRDPVYGSVGHIFTLQQQVVSLQAELAYVQARLSTLAYQLPTCHVLQPQSPITMEQYPQLDIIGLSHDMLDQEMENCDLPSLTREFVSRHLPGVRFRPSP